MRDQAATPNVHEMAIERLNLNNFRSQEQKNKMTQSKSQGNMLIAS